MFFWNIKIYVNKNGAILEIYGKYILVVFFLKIHLYLLMNFIIIVIVKLT